VDVVGGGESEKGSSFGNQQTQVEGLESRESAEMSGQQHITWSVVSSFSTDGRQRLLGLTSDEMHNFCRDNLDSVIDTHHGDEYR
jgi:hypothetical protein